MDRNVWREPGIIELFSTSESPLNLDLIKGIGDDCAVIRPTTRDDFVVTSDMLVEDVHFDLAWHPPFSLGRKAMAVNISDIAAMGGTPRFAFLSIAIPPHVSQDWLFAFRDGIRSILAEFTIDLAGGDTVRGEKMTINVTLIGTVKENRALLRSGAGEGDLVYVSGNLGSAAAGLALCQNPEVRSKLADFLTAPFIKRHLDPLPDVTCGSLLAGSGCVTAMQDISDGLATDLAHLCSQSNVGAEIDSLKLPCHHDLETICDELGCLPEQLKIGGGEDYHLVFTVKAGRKKELERYLAERSGQRIFHVGMITAGSGVILLSDQGDKDISYQGYSHSGAI